MRLLFNQILATILVVLILQGCSKKQEVIFEFPMQLEFEIPAGLNPFDKHFFIVRNVPTNLELLKAQFGVEEGQPLVIKPTNAIMTSKLQNIDLDFIAEVEISLFEEDPDEDIIAFLTDQVPINAGRSIVIIPFDTDFSEQLEKGMVNFKVSIRLRSTTPSFIESSRGG